MSGGKRIFRLGIRTVGGLLGLVLLAVTGIALILAQPRQETADAGKDVLTNGIEPEAD